MELANMSVKSQREEGESRPVYAVRRVFKSCGILLKDPRYREVLSILGRRGGRATQKIRQKFRKSKTTPSPQS